MIKSISENQLDDITHATNAILEAQGIELSNDAITDLNDHLSSFINGRCEISIEPTSEIDDDLKNDVFELSFEIISADVSQTIRITNHDYDEESIIEGLKKGSLVTTTWHGGDTPSIDEVKTGKRVAIVMSQEIDGEYDEYS